MTLSELTTASKIMVGSQQASKIYIGNTQIYSASRLPSGYTELSYISSTVNGSQYIDTGCKLMETTDDIQIDFKFNFKGHGGTKTQSTLLASQPEVSPYPGFVMRIGSYSNQNIGIELCTKWNIPDKIGHSESNKYYYINYEGSTSGGNPRFQTTHTTGEIIEDSIIITDIPAAQVHQNNAVLFCAMNNSNQPFRYSEADIYYLKFTKGGTVLREFIPAKRNSDNEVGLYDIQNNVFYPSQGTNSFVGTALS